MMKKTATEEVFKVKELVPEASKWLWKKRRDRRGKMQFKDMDYEAIL